MDSERRKLSLKPILLASGAVATLAVLGLILKTIGSMTKGSPQAMGETTTITLQSTIAPPVSSNLPETADVTRETAWRELGFVCKGQLREAFSEFDSQLETARSQRWRDEARGEARKSGGKTDEFNWLANNAYLSFADKIQRLTKAGQMTTDSATIKKYRDAKGGLLDVAEALSNTNAPLVPRVAAVGLNKAIDRCYEAASNYLALTDDAASKAKQSPPSPPQPKIQPETQTEQTDGEEVQ